MADAVCQECRGQPGDLTYCACGARLCEDCALGHEGYCESELGDDYEHLTEDED